MSETNTRQLTPEEIDANVKRWLAEADKHSAEAAQFRAEARKADLEADVTDQAKRLAELDVTLKERQRREADAADTHHYTYRFVGGVNQDSVKAAIATLTQWHRLAPDGQKFKVIFFSPGGGVIEGFALFDHITYLRAEGREIETGCTGMAASMGGILVQAGSKRWMSKESWYMIHRAAFGAVGKTYEIEDEVEWVKRIEKRIINIFVSRSGGKLTENKIKRNWDRKDWWISSDECLELGLVDEVR